ncbi:MAG: polysaccharide biosynthesis protein [Bacteroidia bacterium]|nr:MAG: polysaccharide biosynthesis protein [Bacteroidia bacterium]
MSRLPLSFCGKMTHPLKKLAGQTAVYGLSSIVGRLLNYLLTPLYTTKFLHTEYGVVTELFAYSGLLLVLLTYGMETAYFRFSQKYPKGKDVFSTAALPILITSSIFMLCMVLCAQPLANALDYANHSEYIIFFTLIVGFDSITAVPFAKLRKENKALRFAVYKFINIGLNISLNLFFILLCPYVLKNHPESFFQHIYNPSVGIGYIFIANLAASSLTLLLFLPEFLRLNFRISIPLLKKLLAYGLPLLVVGLVGMINEVADRIMLKHLLRVPAGVSNAREYVLGQIGIYGANYKLSVLIVLFIQAFRYAAEPFFFGQARKSDAKKIYALTMRYFVILGLCIVLGIMFYLDIVKYFISNANYWQGLYVVPVLLVAGLFMGIVFNLSIWYKLTDKTHFGIVIAGSGALITLLMNFLLIPKIGFLGSAWTHLVCNFVMMLLSFALGRKYYRIDYPLKDLFMYFLLAALLYVAGRFHGLQGTYKYLINTLLLLLFMVYILKKEKIFPLLLRKIKRG